MTGCGCGAFHPTRPGFDSSQSFVNDFHQTRTDGGHVCWQCCKQTIVFFNLEHSQWCQRGYTNVFLLRCCCVWKIIILFSELIIRVVVLWSIIPLHDWIELYYIALSCTESHWVHGKSLMLQIQPISSKCNKLCTDNNDNFKTSEHLLALCILQHIFIAHPWSGVFTMFVCICKVLTIYNVVQKLQQLADGYLQRPLVILLLPAFEYLFISYCFIVVAKVESCVCCLRRSSNTLWLIS